MTLWSFAGKSPPASNFCSQFYLELPSMFYLCTGNKCSNIGLKGLFKFTLPTTADRINGIALGIHWRQTSIHAHNLKEKAYNKSHTVGSFSLNLIGFFSNCSPLFTKYLWEPLSVRAGDSPLKTTTTYLSASLSSQPLLPSSCAPACTLITSSST